MIHVYTKRLSFVGLTGNLVLQNLVMFPWWIYPPRAKYGQSLVYGCSAALGVYVTIVS